MNIKINNGQNIIRIIASGMVECLIIQRPALAIWPDFQGSIGEYFSVSGHTQEEKKNFTNTIDHFLLQGSEDQILSSIPDFMDLFANGDYEIRFGDIDLQKTKFHKYHISHYDGDPSKKVFYGSLYPYSECETFYTLHYNQINAERVDFYKKIIQDGARPKAIIFSNPKSLREYVLDGHHKIEAYI